MGAKQKQKHREGAPKEKDGLDLCTTLARSRSSTSPVERDSNSSAEGSRRRRHTCPGTRKLKPTKRQDNHSECQYTECGEAEKTPPRNVPSNDHREKLRARSPNREADPQPKGRVAMPFPYGFTVTARVGASVYA
ncbi:hypothetical protein B0H14DRAFT_2570191 [Mycena olivaceomarginata]|nr:hypothetical protein B0H14DRAFT_2570191 [Mycena olivaceomarginata]